MGEYLDYYRKQDKDTAKNWAQYEYKYTLWSSRFGKGRKTTPIDINAPANIDVAFWSADDVFQAMVAQGYDMKVYYKNAADFDGKEFLKYLARKSNNAQLDTDFAKLQKEILDKVASGSYVEDVMGENFDFVEDVNKLALHVDGATLQAEVLNKDKHTYGFGKLQDGSYRFTVQYLPQTKDTQERIKLVLNETIYTNKPITLEYVEKLANVPMAPGEYNLDTNERAVLHPVDGNGVAGEAVEFPKPKVLYKVVPPKPKQVKVTFHDGDVLHAMVKVEQGFAINADSLTDQSMPADPTREGFRFKEWNTAADGAGDVFTGDTVVTNDMDVYAIYEIVEIPQDPETPAKPEDPSVPEPKHNGKQDKIHSKRTVTRLARTGGLDLTVALSLMGVCSVMAMVIMLVRRQFR